LDCLGCAGLVVKEGADQFTGLIFIEIAVSGMRLFCAGRNHGDFDVLVTAKEWRIGGKSESLTREESPDLNKCSKSLARDIWFNPCGLPLTGCPF
jgi:hypothetical protein